MGTISPTAAPCEGEQHRRVRRERKKAHGERGSGKKEDDAKLAGIAREQAEEHPCGRLKARRQIASVRRSPCADVGGSVPKPRADKLRDEQDPDGASPRPQPEHDLTAHFRLTDPKRSEREDCRSGEKHDRDEQALQQ